ncbi:hypothetical protein FIBSPDRAFT_943479 [Athelia psychrophila]|uniref:Uncharacterized protein n=1 Tax=Athelia psychrophila TaxID=1759441 RepID=A0A166WFE6_9AGAM|nr:hypothetical protein FIBSPDRAFT_943479 [Fibularhizoctonia sp. CBS 109695]
MLVRHRLQASNPYGSNFFSGGLEPMRRTSTCTLHEHIAIQSINSAFIALPPADAYIGRTAHDPAQKDARAFCGGEGVRGARQGQEHRASNANDEVGVALED